jgi:TrmH family RNA methyltransferase
MMQLSKKMESLLRSLYTRKGRKKTGLCICEGLRACSEVLQTCPEIIEFAVLDSSFHELEELLIDTSFESFTVNTSKMNSLSATVNSQGIMLALRRPKTIDITTEVAEPFVFVLDQVADPGNFGTMLRTAKSVGLTELWFTSGSVDPYNDKVIRSAMGAQFSMTLREFSNLETLKDFLLKNSYNNIYRTTPHNGVSCFKEPELFDKSAIIIGNEANGVGPLDGSCDLIIPMPGGYESINAAQAATVILFEYVRRIMG